VSKLQDFEGDLLLEDTPDGGDIRIEDGLFISDRSFRTVVYLSLFGGNKEDNGRVRNRKTWWGNTLRGISENQKLTSRFQALIHGLPMQAEVGSLAYRSPTVVPALPTAKTSCVCMPFEALSHGFCTRCLYFTSLVAKAHARLASGGSLHLSG
jgi:hypothetical protein